MELILFHILSSSNPICLTMRERYSLPYLWGFGVSVVDAALPQEVQFTPPLVRHIFTVKHSETPNLIHAFSAENSLPGKYIVVRVTAQLTHLQANTDTVF